MPNELELWKGEVGFPSTDWGVPRGEEPEVEEDSFLEGEYEEVPEREGFWSRAKGFVGRAKEKREGWVEEEFLIRMQERARKLGLPRVPETYEEAVKFERVLPALEKKGEWEEAVRRAKLEEQKAHERGEKRKYRREPLKAFSKAYKAIAGPKHPVSREWYIPKAQAELYVPRIPGWRATPEQVPAGEAHRPQLGMLRRASSPPPSTPVKAPFRDVERFEGLGTAMGRLRGLEKLPRIDQAVYSEIHANGDIDTPSHIKEEVGQLGFSRREIDVSLKRLRDMGLITPTGQESNGEKELMVVGG